MKKNGDAEAKNNGEIGAESRSKKERELFGAPESEEGATALERASGTDEEVENANPHAKTTKIIADGSKGLGRPGLVSYRAIGPSTTLAEVGLTNLCKMRRVGGSTNVACHYGASPYPSICKGEEGRS
jgi:hypothetical protein